MLFRQAVDDGARGIQELQPGVALRIDSHSNPIAARSIAQPNHRCLVVGADEDALRRQASKLRLKRSLAASEAPSTKRVGHRARRR